MRATVLTGLLLGFLTATAEASEAEHWAADLTVGNEWMGPAERPTGGLSVSVGARYLLPLDQRWALVAGPGVELFGFAGGTEWMGAFVSPKLGAVWMTPLDGLAVEITAEMPYGVAPVCNDWALCLDYWGWWPGGTARVGYGSKAVSFILDTTIRYVDTLAWQGAGVRVAGGGRLAW